MILPKTLAATLAQRWPRVWRQAVRMTAAALLAELGTLALHLHQGQWAVITCLVVVQGTFANTLDASLSRIYGTVLGALAGGLCAVALGRSGLPSIVVLGLAVAPTAAMAAADARFRLAPVTAALVVLATLGGAAGLDIAFDRVVEILVGAAIGTACTLFVFPERADAALARHGADALLLLGETAGVHLLGGDVEALLGRLEAAFSKAQVATAEAVREQAVRVSRGPSPRPLMLALRRLRTDVALVERAMLVEAGTPEDRRRAAEAIAAWFATAAAALRSGEGLPDPPPGEAGDEHGEGPREFGALAFALAALHRDQGMLRERIAAFRPAPSGTASS